MFRLLKGVLVGALFCFVLLGIALLFRLPGNRHGHASGSLGDNCAGESPCEVSLMRVTLAVIDVEERKTLECDLKKLLASCE